MLQSHSAGMLNRARWIIQDALANLRHQRARWAGKIGTGGW
jgi:hypothetical protein